MQTENELRSVIYEINIVDVRSGEFCLRQQTVLKGSLYTSEHCMQKMPLYKKEALCFFWAFEFLVNPIIKCQYSFNILSRESLVPQMITVRINNDIHCKQLHVLLTALWKFTTVSKEPFNHLNFMCSQSCFVNYCDAFLYVFNCV